LNLQCCFFLGHGFTSCGKTLAGAATSVRARLHRLRKNSCRSRHKRQGTTSQAAEKLEIEPALYQGTTSQAAEKVEIEPALYQGTTSQAAEKLEIEPALYQGTTSVVPQTHENKGWALAPAGCSSGVSPRFKPFSAAC
jgi:hypothetical protein